ncbi:MAG TPA: FAD-dependent oxidoreductase [Anaerolineaceae bacterium]|nr:FAD-dependent oxidoreductase [Anaerolineaceae bacterium]
MNRYKYLIVGGGMTADAAVRGIRELDPDGSIAVISREPDPPYNRPPLSKGLWKGRPIKNIWRGTDQKGAELILGCEITELDPEGLTVRDRQGESYQGEKLLLATGGAPRRLPFGGDEIIYYRTVRDYHRLAELSETGADFAVIGGGFIGAEIAAALAMNGRKVTMLFPEEGIGARIFPPEVGRFLNDYYREQGVEVLAGEMVSGLRVDGQRRVLTTQSGREVSAAAVVAGIGIRPNVQLAEAAGLELGDGIRVDDLLRTSRPNIYAAGDVAEFYNPALDVRLRVEHEDNANSMGRQAGRNLAGAGEPYHYLPYFYSDLFDLGYEAVGMLDSRLQVIADWQEPFRKGVLYYFDKGRVRGVLLWNVWKKIPAARELIARPGPLRPEDLAGDQRPEWAIPFD